MEDIFRRSLLFDFYGELLTEHQKNIYEEAVMNDMSYSELADIYGISRQGIYDMIKRCDKLLEGYEAKLRLVEKFGKARDKIAKIKTELDSIRSESKDKRTEKLLTDIEKKVTDILDDF